jgi:hypothetical protein
MKEIGPSRQGFNIKYIITIIIMIIIKLINFIQYIYNYIPGVNHVSRLCSVARILCLQFIVHVMLLTMLNVLYFNISTFLSACSVPNVAVVCSSLISCFPFHTNCLND